MSDGLLTWGEIEHASVERCKLWHPGYPNDHWSIADWSNAIAGEAGELANKVKKMRRLETGTEISNPAKYERLRAKVAKEIADVILYVPLLAHKLDINVPEAVVCKFNEKSVEQGFTISLRSHNCVRCDIDRHICPGCGDSLMHGQTACTNCDGMPDREED